MKRVLVCIFSFFSLQAMELRKDVATDEKAKKAQFLAQIDFKLILPVGHEPFRIFAIHRCTRTEVGSISFKVEHKDKTRGWISQVETHIACVRRGVGTTLMRRAFTALEERGVKSVGLRLFSFKGFMSVDNLLQFYGQFSPEETLDGNGMKLSFSLNDLSRC